MTEEKRLGEGNFNFEQPSQKALPFLNNLGNTVNFSLSTLVPMEIEVRSTSGVINLDLTKIKVDLVEIEGAASQITINFAKDYSTKTFIKTSAGLLKLTIPKEAAASLKTDSVLKNINIDQNRFSKEGNTYRSLNFEQSAVKTEIEVSGQAASIEIK
jgi:hypothetical protein